jgi:hypothetical protein
MNAKSFAIEIEDHRGGRCFFMEPIGVTTTIPKYAFKRRSYRQIVEKLQSLGNRVKNPIIVEVGI